ncbi:HK97 family phage prohead protease [Enterococcus avium]|uniref:HK97 family phage prohead protease n=1 Tax=Enterococcus avium TaxID=33945 RepID=UPI00288F3E88|nr:HK97 family phage prohead protease [Enterococcus avium]MDT2392781.1 HK97 family phage prohead protease [Enterococcus avium]MDT2416583.1 HK97 family phage prohead protease [Enterococcus avium]MDT2429883.1 HK97 family phage prohead protease [Enterococcus avium]MDT2438901.1 HK97 family phage prohead protease [Enterococcus avium]MDT2451989.1 HK97 family phage prohead protease [Enterococcus avium]
MPKKREIRTFDITNISTRGIGDEGGATITGYAAVFNSPTMIYEDLQETILPGAFTDAIASSDIRCLFDHDWSKVLGRTKSGTLRLSEDDHGLKFEVDLPNTSIAKDLAESMARGDITQCSFGFIPTAESWDWDSDPVKRTISNVELYEVSVVSLPAYSDAEASLSRSKKDFRKSLQTRKALIKKINSALGA